MPRTTAAYALAALLVVTAACAGTAASTTAAPSAAPQMISRERPDIRFTNTSRVPVTGNLDIRVMIGTDGKPDMATFSVTGPASTNVDRDAIAAWIERATFKPAVHNGVPVRELWKMHSVTRVEVRRIG